MGLGGLQTLDPNALSATKLDSGGMTAQEIAFKRKAFDADLAKTGLAAKAAADEVKQKREAAIPLEAAPPTLSLQHTKFAYDWNANEQKMRSKEFQDWLASGKNPELNPDDRKTAVGQARWQRGIQFNQIASNSKQMEATGSDWQKQIAAHPTWYKPGAKEEVAKWQTSTEPLTTGEIIDMPKELFDLDGAIISEFGHLKEEKEAWASADGTSSGTKTYIPDESFMTHAQLFATDPNAQNSIRERFKEYTPEHQKFVMDYAKQLGTNTDVAMVVEAAKGLYDRVQKTAESEQQSASGYGAKKEEAAARELVEVWKGTAEGSHARFKNVATALPTLKKDDFTKILKSNPQLNSFFKTDETGAATLVTKPGFSILKDYNKYTVGKQDEKSTEDGKVYANAIKPVIVIQDDETNNIMVVSATDTELKNGTVRVSSMMSPSQQYSQLFVPIALNTPGYDAGALDLVTQKEGIDISGTNANINPWNKPVTQKVRGAEDQPAAKKKEGVYNPITGQYE